VVHRASVIGLLLLEVAPPRWLGCCLRRALQEDCGGVAVSIVRGSHLPRRSGRGDASGNEVLSDFLSTWLKDHVVS
jgi:hypothetical protein